MQRHLAANILRCHYNKTFQARKVQLIADTMTELLALILGQSLNSFEDMTGKNVHINFSHAACSDTIPGSCKFSNLFYSFWQGSFNKITNYNKKPHKKLMKRKLCQNLLFTSEVALICIAKKCLFPSTSSICTREYTALGECMMKY